MKIAKKAGSRWTASSRGRRKVKIDNFEIQIPQHASFFVELDLSKLVSPQRKFSCRRSRSAKLGWIRSV